jgi:hypothetical protein
MLSQSPGIYILLSSVISGILLLSSNYINNKFQLEREEKQRIWQEKSDQQKWYREKIYDCYIRAIQSLTKIIKEDFEIEIYINNCSPEYFEMDQDVFLESKRTNIGNLTWEFYADLNIIEAGYPDKDSKEFKEFNEKLNECLKKTPISVGVMITQLMENDSRIKINK